MFEFKDPDSGRVHKANSKSDLVKLIIAYRQQNNYDPIELIDTVVDNYLCMLPNNAGKCAPFFPIKRGLWATFKGGVAVVKSLLYKSFATQEEADRRAAICKDCIYNVFPDKERFVRWSDSIAEASVGARKSKYHEELGNCDVCTCPLRAKVFFKGDIELTPEQISKMKKVNCWQTENL